MYIVLGLNRGQVHFLNFLMCSNDFILQKVYFLRLMRVYVGLIMLDAYFCHSCLLQVEYDCLLIKVDWLAACIALRIVGCLKTDPVPLFSPRTNHTCYQKPNQSRETVP
jgi:hypothetical protein